MRSENKFTMEKMRYAVPKVCNRFFGVHIRFILLCALISVLAITVTLSAVIIGRVQELEPKPAIVFYCEVDDIDAVRSGVEKYGSVFDIAFVAYGDSPKKEDETATNKALMRVYTRIGYLKRTVDYNEVGLPVGYVLTLAEVERLIDIAEGLL